MTTLEQTQSVQILRISGRDGTRNLLVQKNVPDYGLRIFVSRVVVARVRHAVWHGAGMKMLKPADLSNEMTT